MKINKIITTLLSTILLMSLFATSAFAATDARSENEPNNGPSKATSITQSVSSYTTIKLFGALNQTGDVEDWIKFNQSSSYSYTKNAIFFYAPSGGTYEFTIYDNYTEPIETAIVNGDDMKAFTDVTFNNNQHYYFEVKLKSGVPTEPYRIEVRVSSHG